MTSLTTYRGSRGAATELAIDHGLDGSDTTIAWWLLTGDWHPVWPQFVISVVHLDEIEGRPPPHLHFSGATHELVVLALNPEGPHRFHTAATLEAGGLVEVGGFLEPVDVVHQFTATDDEMVDLADLCAKACVEGVLNPSTDDAREYLREQWLAACVRSLAHMRGEEHA